jgi:hypothetical protein
MKHNTTFYLLGAFLGLTFACTVYMWGVVIIEKPVAGAVFVEESAAGSKVNIVYKKAQALRMEFPELALLSRCEAFMKYKEQGKPERPVGAPVAELDRAWELQLNILKLQCNFETMWVKIKAAAQNPETTSEEYFSTLASTLSAWEISWREACKNVK